MSKGVVINIADIPSGTKIQRRPGRPRKVYAAVVDEADYLKEIRRQRDEHIEGAPLVAGEPDALEVVEQLVVEVARETAALSWESRRAAERGQDGSQTCSRRVDALVKLASLFLERHRLRRDSDRVPEDLLVPLREQWLSAAREVAHEILGDRAEVFLEASRALMESSPAPAR